MRAVDDSAAKRLAPDALGDLDVRSAHALLHTLGIRLIQTLDQDLPGVATDPGDDHHGEDGPVTALVHGVRKGHDEHPLSEKRMRCKFGLRTTVTECVASVSARLFHVLDVPVPTGPITSKTGRSHRGCTKGVHRGYTEEHTWGA